MDDDSEPVLRRLLDEQPVAALATLHRGEPAVSMVPFVLPPHAGHLVIHVSALATHTRDMLAHARVAVLVRADVRSGMAPQALPRVSLQADAERLLPDGAQYVQARGEYLARFADAAPIFDLPDFSIFVLRPRSVRLVAGFGRASTLTGDRLRAWLRKE